jgi:hypothetical protein
MFAMLMHTPKVILAIYRAIIKDKIARICITFQDNQQHSILGLLIVRVFIFLRNIHQKFDNQHQLHKVDIRW